MSIRNLFCLSSGALSGGNKILLELAHQLAATGQHVDVFLWDKAKLPDWFKPHTNIVDHDDIADALSSGYDLVYFANAFLVPLALPYIGNARGVLISQGYESFCYGTSYEDCLSEVPALAEIMRLPVKVIATSRSVQQIFEQQLNRRCLYVPVGIEDGFFTGSQPIVRNAKQRILMVGNYLQPVKGMADGFAAIAALAAELPVTLVLVTQQKHGGQLLRKQNLDSEVHFAPSQVESIYRSCDLYCCSSWYEGFGLPAIEAFACGVPVVSTRNRGVSDYGIDGVNLLLAEPHSPGDLAEKMKMVLSDRDLARSLTRNGLETAKRYQYARMLDAFLTAQQEILDSPAPELNGIARADMDKLLDNLELAGVFTPLSIQQELSLLSARLFDTLDVIMTAGASLSEIKSRLETIRDNLRLHLHNEKSESYPAFKSRFDICRFVLASLEEERLRDYVSLLVCGKGS